MTVEVLLTGAEAKEMNSDIEFHIKSGYPWSKLPGVIKQVCEKLK